MSTTQWFLTSRERGNPSTRLDSRHHGDVAWTEGNLVRPLVHGATFCDGQRGTVRVIRREEVFERGSRFRDCVLGGNQVHRCRCGGDHCRSL